MSRRKLIWSPSAVQLVLLWHNYFVVACDETQKTLCGVLLGFAQHQKFEKKNGRVPNLTRCSVCVCAQLLAAVQLHPLERSQIH